MRQSTAVVLVMLAAFLVFVTVRGELPSYLNVLFGAVPAAGAATVPTAGSVVSTILNPPPSINGIAQGGIFGTGGLIPLTGGK